MAVAFSIWSILACATGAFLDALDEDAANILISAGKRLDVKGAGWIAAFPVPNITVKITEDADAADIQIDEEFEKRADETPSEFDFLGKEIDSGFRVARYKQTSDRFTPSAELAWMLCLAHRHRLFTTPQFLYHGRQILKGVIGDRPYLIISLDSERNPLRRMTRARERAVTREVDTTPLNLEDFLHSFMVEENIDRPVIPRLGEEIRDPRSS